MIILHDYYCIPYDYDLFHMILIIIQSPGFKVGVSPHLIIKLKPLHDHDHIPYDYDYDLFHIYMILIIIQSPGFKVGVRWVLI